MHLLHTDKITTSLLHVYVVKSAVVLLKVVRLDDDKGRKCLQLKPCMDCAWTWRDGGRRAITSGMVPMVESQGSVLHVLHRNAKGRFKGWLRTWLSGWLYIPSSFAGVPSHVRDTLDAPVKTKLLKLKHIPCVG